MPPAGQVTAGDVDQLRALTLRVRSSTAHMSAARHPLTGMAHTVEQAIGGTATGKDRAFVDLLTSTAEALSRAVSECLNAAAALDRASMAAAQQLQAQQQEARRRV